MFDTTYSNIRVYDDKANQYPHPVALVINTQARLVTLNVVDEETGETLAFNCIPGRLTAGTPVPAAALASDFAKNQIATGGLVIGAL